MTNIVNFTGGTKLIPSDIDEFASFDDLSEGVMPSLAVLSLRGSKFRIRYKGEETLLKSSDNVPLGSLDVVLLKANKHLQKRYYDKTYNEGDTDLPTCFSMDNVRPDPSVQTPQCETCAACPKNVIGSDLEALKKGRKAKACKDSRRVAFVPKGDLVNERFGGPMLLTVPTMSLKSLMGLSDTLKYKYGNIPYNRVITRLTFGDAAYPLLQFEPIEALPDTAIAALREHYTSGAVSSVLQDTTELNKPMQSAAPAGGIDAAAASIREAVDEEIVAKVVEEPEPEPKPKRKTRAKKAEPKPEPVVETAAELAEADAPDEPRVVDVSDAFDATLEGLF